MQTKINYTKLKLLGTFRNNWRERNVSLYEHPTDPESIVSVGVGFHDGKETVCEELRIAYMSQLEHNNWEPIN